LDKIGTAQIVSGTEREKTLRIVYKFIAKIEKKVE